MTTFPPFPQNYKIVTKKTSGDLHIKKHAQYNDIDARKVIVAKGIKARLYGQVLNLVLEKDSLVYLHGNAARITNNGGSIYRFPYGDDISYT